MNGTVARITVATQRKTLAETLVLRDELPPLEHDEIRLRVDKVGLSANNLFYAQMGEAPFLKFFSVYPLSEEHKDLAIVPAWGVATIIESANPEFTVGEQYRGFLHMTNVVQMKARRTAEGFQAFGGKRDKINQAYNGFLTVAAGGTSPIAGEGPKADLAMTSAPGGGSGFILYELLKMHAFYGANSVVLTSASSKLSLVTAQLLREQRDSGELQCVVGYTAKSNQAFVRSTGLYDLVICYEDALPDDTELKHLLVDVAGDAAIYKRGKDKFVKAFAVGGTHADAEASVFTAFGPSGFVKMLIDMVAPASIKTWAARRLSPKLEMFFAPTVISELLDKWGHEQMDIKSDAALTAFVDAAIDGNWMSVHRAETPEAAQAAYRRIVEGKVPPAEAVILALAEG
ncbi:DUF2855 family protein [Halieaceae bacterium IMCC14734]|uniref:DUF2855 family protein n=1 Tax=Candidatus Litorirhabdus singularis TaxID=2518993 RepID=A0ABT3TEV4_9GAMM|nr:DUF2855 family protein [Candidatus Litorirhabdus singularis]MCX2980730.1 DUF2855 family protein [Candidatus Litorirhabdus singularis]